jgi:hypothetical protein
MKDLAKPSSVPGALRALAAMEKQLTAAKTYEALRRIEREANALKFLMGHVAEVKTKAEDTVLLVNHRIGEELAKVPKASGRPTCSWQVPKGLPLRCRCRRWQGQ